MNYPNNVSSLVTRARPAGEPGMAGADCYGGQPLSQSNLAPDAVVRAFQGALGQGAGVPPVDPRMKEALSQLLLAQAMPLQDIPPLQKGLANNFVIEQGSTAGTVLAPGGVSVPANGTAVLSLKPNYPFKPERLIAGASQATTGNFFLTDVKKGGISVWPNLGGAAAMDWFTLENVLCPIAQDYGVVTTQMPLTITIVNTDNAVHTIALAWYGTYLRGTNCG